MKLFLTMIVCAAYCAPLSAQWLTQRTAGIPRTADGRLNLAAPPPRTPDGKSDFSGLWAVPAPTTEFQPTEISPWVQTLVRTRAEDFYKDSPAYHCLPLGPQRSSAGGIRRILQTSTVIAILYEDLTYRQIFLD